MLAASAGKIRPGEDGMPLVESPPSVLCRLPSCVEDPQAGALQALEAADLRLLSDLLAEEGLGLAPDHAYPDRGFRTLLHVALEQGNLEAVRIIVAGGAKPHHYNPSLKVAPLHVAVGRCDSKAVALLLSAAPPGHLEPRDRMGRTPLLLAAQKGDEGLACLRLLLDAGASVEAVDSRGGQGALGLSAAADCWPAVAALVARGATASPPVRAALQERFGAARVAGLQFGEAREGVWDQLKAELDRADLGRGDLVEWERLVAGATPTLLDQATSTTSLVQLCAERGLEQHLERMLEQGADPNTTTLSKPTSPLLLAGGHGKPGVFRVLVSHPTTRIMDIDPVLGHSALHQVIRKPLLEDLGDGGEGRDYPSCLHLLLAQPRAAAMVNCQDLLGNTPLHYATQFWDQDTVTKLLELGANIGLRNKAGEAPIAGILPATMEKFLDNSCLKSDGNPTNQDFKITFDYSFLAPPRDNAVEEIVDKDGEEEAKPAPETDVLWYMARSTDHRHLLKHPVITSFLALKWSRISHHYNANIACFALFVAILTAYIFTNYAGFSLNVSAPICSSDTNSTTTPVSPLYYGNHPSLWVITTVLLAILAIREVLQCSISPSQYLSSVENIFEVVLIVLVGIILFDGEPGCNLSYKRAISSTILLISWIELVSMVGRHPRLSNYNIYSTMFFRVLKTFATFLTWYSLFLFAFGLGFYILLHEDNEGADRDYAFFDHLGLCLVKTFSMFVGELEFSDIPFNSPFSYIFFITFVFLIVIVLMNLLNGLAVSDTGLIRTEAEIHAHVSRVEVIAQLEATLLGDPSLLLQGGLLSRLLPSCGLRRRLGRFLRLGSLFRLVTASKGVLLFYRVLPNRRVTVQPNRPVGLCCLGPQDHDGPYQHQDLAQEIGQDVLKSAKRLILHLAAEVGTGHGMEEIMLRQQQLEEKLESVIKSLEKVVAKLA